jgi:hypothetical protein
MLGNSTAGRRWRRAIRTAAAGMTGLLAVSTAVIGGTAATAGAATPPVASPSWHIVKQVKGAGFTAVVATGKAAGWAFTGSNPPAAYKQSGRTWTRAAFPG